MQLATLILLPAAARFCPSVNRPPMAVESPLTPFLEDHRQQ
jgi:hypothetical protein